MALTVTLGNPIRATGTTAVSQAVIAPSQAVYVNRIYWFNPTTAGHLCTLKDSRGNFITELRAESNNGSQQIEIDAYFDDIYCDDMDSGTLYIYTR